MKDRSIFRDGLLASTILVSMSLLIPSASSAPVASTATEEVTRTEQNALSELEKAGYTQVRDVKPTPEGISAKAVKDGKEVSLVIDSSGKIHEK